MPGRGNARVICQRNYKKRGASYARPPFSCRGRGGVPRGARGVSLVGAREGVRFAGVCRLRLGWGSLRSHGLGENRLAERDLGGGRRIDTGFDPYGAASGGWAVRQERYGLARAHPVGAEGRVPASGCGPAPLQLGSLLVGRRPWGEWDSARFGFILPRSSRILPTQIACCCGEFDRLLTARGSRRQSLNRLRGSGTEAEGRDCTTIVGRESDFRPQWRRPLWFDLARLLDLRRSR